MWNLLSTNEDCRRTQDVLENLGGPGLHANTLDELMEELPTAARVHIRACSLCQEAASDLMATRALFRDAASEAQDDRPFFAARVMAAISAREKELANLVSPWSEVPRFASRLAWIAALLLLVATTWFYEKGRTAPNRATSGDASPESIFEAPPPANQDDVLISMVEMQP